MPNVWDWKRNDTNPISGTLKKNNQAHDIQGASLRFHMLNANLSEVIVDAAADNDQIGDGSDGSKGKWSYDPAAADTDESGTYWGEVEVTYADTKIETFPKRGYFKIRIGDDLA